MRISVVIPTRNPRRDYLTRVMAALARQTLPATEWEACVVDNGSTPPLQSADLVVPMANLRIAREPEPGIVAARLCGIRETSGELLAFIDDDTVPAPDFLTELLAFMTAHPQVGTAGGRIIGEFEIPLPEWLVPFAWSLALRDSGDAPLEWRLGQGEFPSWTPIGAGLVVRRVAIVPAYPEHVARYRQEIARNSWHGQGSGSAEDKDLVLLCLRLGWVTGYAPALRLTHLIPASRMAPARIEHLVPTLETLWMRTLHAHGMDLFDPIHPATLWVRQVRSWVRLRAWRSRADRLRWLSSTGRLRGLADNYGNTVRYALPRAIDAATPPCPSPAL